MDELYNPVEVIRNTKEIPASSSDVVKLRQEVDTIRQSSDFSTSPFIQFFHSIELQGLSIDLRTALEINLYPLLQPEINYRIKTNQNMNWSIFGAPGTGKSLAGLSVYEHISRTTGVSLKTRNMFTNGALLYNRLLELFPRKGHKKDLQKNDVIFVDENVRDQTGLGAVHAMSQQSEMEIRIRKAMIHFVWVSTVLYPHQSTVVMETYDAQRDPEAIWKLTRIRCLVYDHGNTLRGSLIIPAPSVEVIEAYMKHIKDLGLESFFSGETDQRAVMLRKISEQCSNDKEFTKLANREQRLQYIDENFGYLRLTLGQQQRVLGLCKPEKKGFTIE
jgi:hypothetical protein